MALYTISLATADTVDFISKGFALGGVDPYFSLFTGVGPTATFLGSNYVQAFSTGGDFDLPFALGAGDYTFAIGAFANMSFAENLGSGSLGDGFTGLGERGVLGDYYYEVDVTGSVAPVPEPSSIALLALPALFLLARKQLRGRRVGLSLRH